MGDPLSTLLLGRVLDERYRVEDLIGRGGMSLLFRATDLRLRRSVALKVLAPPGAAESDRALLRRRLRQEAESAARIPPHPNVVQIYDHGTDRELDIDYITMELLIGRDLRTEMRERGLPRDTALRVLREAARGVAAGHRHGIAHRDVKPANVFLLGDHDVEGVKILDFGIARLLVGEEAADSELTRTGSTPHSPAYASPEQLRGERGVGPASDVFQLGVLGVELFTGARPFGEAERERIRRGEPVQARLWGEGSDDVPATVRSVLARALEIDPGQRFPDAVGFLRALDGAEASTAATGATPGGDEEERTLLAPDARGPAALHPPARGPRGVPVRGHSRAATPRIARGALIAAGTVAMLALAGVLATGGGRDGGAHDGADVVLPLEAEETEEAFRELLLEAHRNLEAAGPALDAGAAADDVQRVVLDLYEARVMGDLDREASHYADRVERGSSRVRLSRIRSEREAEMEAFDTREITIDRQAIEMIREDEARALVDWSWTFAGREERWTGSARDELRLRLRSGRWLVVAHDELEVFRSERDP